MPCFPPPGSTTICEINRELVASEKYSDERAKESYGKVLGVVFSPVSFQTDAYSFGSEQGLEQENGDVLPSSGLNAILTSVSDSVKRILSHRGPVSGKPFAKVDVQGVSWHPHKHLFAFISSPNQVTICDYDESDCKDPSILTSESLGNVTALDWRSKSGRTLAVACEQGICIWSASYPGNAATVRSVASSLVGTISRGSGVRWTLVDLFRHPYPHEKITSLSWSPDGRLLASSSIEGSSFTIWDVSQGSQTPIRRGLGNIAMLKWSPMGDYFFTAKTDGSFYLWETSTWNSEHWSSTSGYVTGAIWDPSGRMILLSFSDSLVLASIHFSSKPPSLDAHLLPVDLPDFSSIGSNGFEKIAWDASGERLAVSYKGGNETYVGLIAIYDVKRGPLVSASLVGFIRGPGEKARPLAFAFHDKFRQGPLLSVCWSSGWCCTYPLLFRSHILL